MKNNLFVIVAICIFTISLFACQQNIKKLDNANKMEEKVTENVMQSKVYV